MALKAFASFGIGLLYAIGGAISGLVAGVCSAATYISIRNLAKLANSGVPVNIAINRKNVPAFVLCLEGKQGLDCAFPGEINVVLKYVTGPVVFGAAVGVAVGTTIGLSLYGYNLYQQRQRQRYRGVDDYSPLNEDATEKKGSFCS